MDSAPSSPAAGPAARVPSDRRRRWLRTDEGWSASQDLARLGGGVAIAALAIGLKLLIARLLGGDIGYVTYVGAVALAAWMAGSRGGLVTTAICTVAETGMFSGPLGSLLTSPVGLIRLGVFVFDGAIVTFITSGLRQAMVREKVARAVGETRLEAQTEAYAVAERDRAALVSLQAVTASLAAAATPIEVADAILDRGMTALGAIAGGVSNLSEDGRALELIAARGYPQALVDASARYALDGPSHLRDAVVRGLPVFLDDPDTWATRYPASPPAPLPDSPTGGSIAVLPLRSSGRTIGAVLFRFATRREFGDAMRDLALGLADQGAQALDRALAYDREREARFALERSGTRLSFTAQASDLIGSAEGFEAGVLTVPRIAVPSLADWCAIELPGLDRAVAATAATSAELDDAVKRLSALAPRGLATLLVPEAARTGAGIAAFDGDSPAGPVDGVAAAAVRDLATRSVLVAMVGRTDRAPLGAIVLGSAVPGRYGPDDLAMARDLAGRIAVAAERSRLFAAVTRFKATVDVSADAVYMFDPDTLLLTYENRGGADLVGFEPVELAGETVLRLLATADEATFRRRLADLRATEGRSATYADLLARRDGREIPVDIFIQEVSLPDGTRTAILTARDISDRLDVQARLARIAGDERRQAAELRAVIQAMGEGVLVVDPDRRITLANEAAMELLADDLPAGLADLEARLGIEPDGLDPRLEEGGGPPARPPLVVQLDGGRWLEVAAYLADLGGSVGDDNRPSLIVVLRDVTDARNAEAGREAFLGVLSHELRTPVTTIYGYAKVLRRPGRHPDQAEMLGDIEIEADRLYRIVEDLLALRRVEGGLTIDGEPLLVQHLVGPVVESEAQRWEGITFELDLPPDLPAVFGERTYVEQVLRNLSSNAGKYGRRGTVVTVQAQETPGEVLVRVLDRGTGIDAEEADRLFDLYYRAPGTARVVAGSGIGLYVARGLVRAMGGRIWARPRPGGGSEFGFSLPRCDEEVALPGPA